MLTPTVFICSRGSWMRLFWRTKVALGLEFSPRLNEKRVRGRRRVIGGLISCGDRGLRDLECFCKGFFSEVVAEAEEGDFECCVEGEFSFSGIYFFPDEVLIQGCGVWVELYAGEPGCTIVVQRSFPVWLENICSDLSSIFYCW